MLRQLLLFALAYAGYQLVRGLVATSGPTAYADARRIIGLERRLHIFAEPSLQRWVAGHAHWLLTPAAFIYVNAHFALTVGALTFIYLRRNASFYFVRNMFMVAMLIALTAYALYPTAPPRLMPAWGFSDTVRQFLHANIDRGAGSVLFNPYAAVPSMHVCVALMISLPMVALVRHRIARVAWLSYPVVVAFVVVVTANHYFTDVLLGALTAAVSAAVALRLLPRARPGAWEFRGAAGPIRSSV